MISVSQRNIVHLCIFFIYFPFPTSLDFLKCVPPTWQSCCLDIERQLNEKLPVKYLRANIGPDNTPADRSLRSLQDFNAGEPCCKTAGVTRTPYPRAAQHELRRN